MAKKEDNLIKNSDRTPSERVEQARKAGIASVAKRRKNKEMREWAKIFGAMPFKVQNADGSTTESTYDGAMIASAYQRAILEKDVRAMEFLAKLTGQLESKVKVDAEVSGDGIAPLTLGEIDPEALAMFILDAQKKKQK